LFVLQANGALLKIRVERDLWDLLGSLASLLDLSIVKMAQSLMP
jgi:hypothetical protein